MFAIISTFIKDTITRLYKFKSHNSDNIILKLLESAYFLPFYFIILFGLMGYILGHHGGDVELYIGEDTWLWFFSTSAQTFGAIVGLVIVAYIYIMDKKGLKSRKKKIDKYSRRIINIGLLIIFISIIALSFGSINYTLYVESTNNYYLFIKLILIEYNEISKWMFIGGFIGLCFYALLFSYLLIRSMSIDSDVFDEETIKILTILRSGDSKEVRKAIEEFILVTTYLDDDERKALLDFFQNDIDKNKLKKLMKPINNEMVDAFQEVKAELNESSQLKEIFLLMLQSKNTFEHVEYLLKEEVC